MVFLLYEVYETMAGVDNHRRLVHEDEEDSGFVRLMAWVEMCERVGGSSDVVHSLW